MKRRDLAAALVLLALLTRPAGAVVLGEDELEETSTEVGFVARTFSFLLTGPLLELFGTEPSGMAVLDLRAYFAHKSPALSIVSHLNLTSTVRAHDLGGSLALGRSFAPPRWLPLRVGLAEDPTVSVIGAVDWLYASYTRDLWTITVGRQPITFGRGKLFRPSDVVATFALTEVDTEFKSGADALRIDWSPAENTNLSLVAVTGELEVDNDVQASLQGTSILVRGERGIGASQIGGIVGFVRGDGVLGVDGVIDMDGYEIYGEATATVVTERSLGRDPDLIKAGDIVPRAVLGASFKAGDVTLSPEFVYNGFGARLSDQYLTVAASPRVAIGEQSTLGRYYTGLVVGWQLHPLWSLGGVALANLGDRSALASLAVRGNLSDNSFIVVGGYIGAGKTPELVGLDLVVEDEFGLYPRFFFAELELVY